MLLKNKFSTFLAGTITVSNMMSQLILPLQTKREKTATVIINQLRNRKQFILQANNGTMKMLLSNHSSTNNLTKQMNCTQICVHVLCITLFGTNTLESHGRLKLQNQLSAKLGVKTVSSILTIAMIGTSINRMLQRKASYQKLTKQKKQIGR